MVPGLARNIKRRNASATQLVSLASLWYSIALGSASLSHSLLSEALSRRVWNLPVKLRGKRQMPQFSCLQHTPIRFQTSQVEA